MLDSPRDERVVQGVISFSGWVLFDGSPADRIEAHIGGEPPVVLRRGVPRPDVVRSSGAGHPAAIGAGFSGSVPVQDRWRGTTLEVVVRAVAEGGDVWTSPLVHVQVRDRVGPVDEVDELTLDVLWRGEEPAGRVPGDRPRVCVFTHSLNLGGGELYLQELLLRLHREHPVELLVVSPQDGPLKAELRRAGISVHITTHHPVDPSRYLGRVSELMMVLRAWGADVVLVNTLGEFAPVDAALEADVPVVWAIHESFELDAFSDLLWGERGLHPEVDRRWRRALASANTVFEAEATLRMFADEVPGLRGRIIHYGVDVAEIARYRREHDRDRLRADLGFEPQHTVLLCMGVFQERKSQLALVLAFARLAVLFPDARLVLVGDQSTNYAAAVREAVDGLGLADQVHVIPIQRDTYRWYHAADVLVSASDLESLPRSVLEAMAFGLPTMAADVFGLSEVIHDGVNGWLCRASSGNALTVGLRRALECSPGERQQLSRACLDASTAHDSAHYPAEYFQLMTSALATHRARRAARG